MSEARLEGIVHVVVAKPIAWTLFGIWLAMKYRLAMEPAWALGRRQAWLAIDRTVRRLGA